MSGDIYSGWLESSAFHTGYSIKFCSKKKGCQAQVALRPQQLAQVMSSAQQKQVILAISDKKAVKIFDRDVVNISRLYLPVQLLSPPRACTDWAEEQQKHLSLPTGLFTALTSRPRLLIGRDVEPRLLIGRRKNRFWQRRRGRPRPCCSLTADSVLKCQRGSGSGLLTYGGASQYNEGLLRTALADLLPPQ